MERCRREIASIEAEILAGNPDLPGLCLALSDWSAELRILQDEVRRNENTQSDRTPRGWNVADASRTAFAPPHHGGRFRGEGNPRTCVRSSTNYSYQPPLANNSVAASEVTL